MTAYEKDPKKVTAGRAGAAARKKNYQAKAALLGGGEGGADKCWNDYRKYEAADHYGGCRWGCASTHTCSIAVRTTSGTYECNAIEGRKTRGHATFAVLLIR